LLKIIITYFIVFGVVSGILYPIHQLFFNSENINFNIVIKESYIFHLLFSLFICVSFQLATLHKKIFSQLGFVYLGTLILKIGLYAITFKTTLFNSSILNLFDKISLLIPVFIYLFLEVYFVSKILNR